jgi:hypothetical protein
VAMLFSHPSLGCEVLKVCKSVSRVDELPNEWQPIERIPIGDQTIQSKRRLISVSSIVSQNAVSGLRPPLMMNQQLIDPSPVIPERGAVAGESKRHIHRSESGKGL